MSRRKPSVSAADTIEIIGATANNLRRIDVQLPLRATSMIVGVSGSGKSSLLEDILATAGNGRMKRFLGLAQDHLPMDDDVPAFVGPLPASIHFSQGAFRASRRTTVATCSGLLATLRQLYIRHGSLWSEIAGQQVPEPSPTSYALWLSRHYRGMVKVWAVPMRWVAGDGQKPAETLRKEGLLQAVLRSETDAPRVWKKGRVVSLEGFRPLNPDVRHVLEAEIATLKVTETNTDELVHLLERAFAAGGGTIVIELPDAGEAMASLAGPRGLLLDSDLHHVHPEDPRPYAPPSPALLSFNMPSNERSGACPHCEGIGDGLEVPEGLLVTHPERSLHEGAVALWTPKNYKYINVQHETIEGLRGIEGVDPDKPWKRLSPVARQAVLQGGFDVTDRDPKSGHRLGAPRLFEGLATAILRRYRKGGKTAVRLAPFVQEGTCPECSGSRWSYQARALKVGEWGIDDLLNLPFSVLVESLHPRAEQVCSLPPAARSLVARIQHHARSFVSVGLGHLAGDRGMLTLSEGESRRLRLAGLLNVQGQNLALLLDEPARGLHEQDIDTLVGSLQELKRSHTVILNDHRFSLARAVDHVLELGPGAGSAGGRVVRCGTPGEILQREQQGNRTRLKVPARHPSLRILGGSLHNVRNVSCRLPLGRLVTITGVSGSGKSNFVRGILLPALAQEMGGRVSLEDFATRSGRWRQLEGCEGVQEVLALDQRRPEANRRSLVATFLGVADALRRVYAKIEAARQLKLSASDFGLNAGSGRCDECLGLGELDDGGSWVLCPGCGGRRFGEAVQSVRSEGLNMVELLNMSFSDLAARDLTNLARFTDLFSLLEELDLGYLALGRRVDRLSGGEVQRLRIAHRLWQAGAEGLLLVLDEPSAGLHPADVARLLKVFDRIVGQGRNTVLLVEHQLDLIRASDWIIDFGPGGGPQGGKILAQGPPEELRALETPTARALRRQVRLSNKKVDRSSSAAQNKTPSSEEARLARRWLQVLLGHEVNVPAEDQDGGVLLGVEAEPKVLAACRPHEIGGLDRELATLALLTGERPPLAERVPDFVETWTQNPQARLYIHPLLHALQTWGPHLPRSVFQAAIHRLQPLGLDELVEGEGPLHLRAGGKRFQASSKNATEFAALLNDALVLGGGYAELQDPDGYVLATLENRAMAMNSGIVAPARLGSKQLCRHHVAGQCLACRGEGGLPAFDQQLVVKNDNLPVESERLLQPEALAILKGVRRLSMLPFFRRLEEEELWDRGEAFSRLAEHAKNQLLHGFWCRPGPGTFLKNRKADPKVVGSWLRWDGLYRTVLGQLDRSRHRDWAEAVKGSLRRVACVVCEGSGLARSSRVIDLAGRSLHHWTVSASVGELYTALQYFECHSKQERALLHRLIHCLEPLMEKHSSAPLGHPLGDENCAQKVYERVVQAFTHLPIASAR